MHYSLALRVLSYDDVDLTSSTTESQVACRGGVTVLAPPVWQTLTLRVKISPRPEKPPVRYHRRTTAATRGSKLP